MAATKNARHTHPWRRLVVFALIIIVFYGILALTKTWTPRLGLDLRGGTTITLTANGGVPSKDNLETARNIIQERVDALGVGESTVTVQGNNQIEVAVPNVSNDELVNLVGTTAQLGFRNVFAVQQAAGNPSPSPSPQVNNEGVGTGLPVAPSPVSSPTQAPTATEATPAASGDFTTNLSWQPAASDQSAFAQWNCGDPQPQGSLAYFSCDDAGQGKYLLGPELLSGQRVSTAQAAVPQGQVAWEVDLKFDSQGADEFSKATAALAAQQAPLNQFAIVLDGKVVSAPTVSSAITGGSASISGGGINQTTANTLANQLKFGALPISFTTSSVDAVSATLGGEQLHAGLIAGLIGLGLVVLYSFIYYRGLGVVVIGSLVAATVITWATLVLLGQTVGFAMSLPGIAGAIVAIGVTADSFIVYFERIRDEIRDGYSLRHSIQTGWAKARTTIVMADAVQLLSAVVLFVLAIGTVKGFAFTLGVTTAIDLFIVFFFTHPLMSLLGRTKFYGQGKRFSGFEPEHLGVSRQSLMGRRGAGSGNRRNAASSKSTRRPASQDSAQTEEA